MQNRMRRLDELVHTDRVRTAIATRALDNIYLGLSNGNWKGGRNQRERKEEGMTHPSGSGHSSVMSTQRQSKKVGGNDVDELEEVSVIGVPATINMICSGQCHGFKEDPTGITNSDKKFKQVVRFSRRNKAKKEYIKESGEDLPSSLLFRHAYTCSIVSLRVSDTDNFYRKEKKKQDMEEKERNNLKQKLDMKERCKASKVHITNRWDRTEILAMDYYEDNAVKQIRKREDERGLAMKRTKLTTRLQTKEDMESSCMLGKKITFLNRTN